ncbi:CGNR zinc finger domain-containing protein [Streptomyces sp. NPDC046805]|uniref:CGNR zinc finger domain-containing protein n=1 Tax=Streptomyces sp. NPDC046805 TaxID=3155134 RepID=UPI0033F48853
MTERVKDGRRTRVTAQLRELRFDAGSLSLNLIATTGRRPSTPIERMGDIDRLRAWCKETGLTVHPDEDLVGLLDALHELRACAYDVTAGYLHRRAPQEDSVRLLNQLARVNPPAPQLEADADSLPATAGSPGLSAPALLSLIARDLITLISDPKQRQQLRECDSEICRMIYLDAAQGRPRKWCSMQRCGNSTKAARHRRHREKTGDLPMA